MQKSLRNILNKQSKDRIIGNLRETYLAYQLSIFLDVLAIIYVTQFFSLYIKNKKQEKHCLGHTQVTRTVNKHCFFLFPAGSTQVFLLLCLPLTLMVKPCRIVENTKVDNFVRGKQDFSYLLPLCSSFIFFSYPSFSFSFSPPRPSLCATRGTYFLFLLLLRKTHFRCVFSTAVSSSFFFFPFNL